MEIVRQGAGNTLVKRIEHQGGVFAPVNGKGMRPAYVCGPKDGKLEGDPLILYTCPTSAIPVEIWQLLNLWWACRLAGLPPVAGGFLDQPVMVQFAFPIFEAQMRAIEQSRQVNGQQQAAGMAVAAMTKVLTGGGG